MKKLYSLILIFFVTASLSADEGMWMLPSIQEINFDKMQKMGLEMSAEEIYSETASSLKDAIVIFGGGCTGVMVSPKGLLFTNHHCGYSAIQKLSSVENNYLRDGFTAKTMEDELACEGLSVTFMIRTENVTAHILEAAGDLEGSDRKEAIKKASDTLIKEAEKESDYYAQVRSFYSGNEYHLFVYERFNDVRLAYTPPSSIGKFGGETDNWMYPRHTGDFSVFRVYADSTGKSAAYSAENVPYQPKRYAPVSAQGFNEGDYAMILGNPGSTNRYASSFAITDRVNNGNSARIDMRGVKQEVWKEFMLADEAINIAYANKYASSSNYWKNSIGMNNAIKNLNIITQKERQEARFKRWIQYDTKRQSRYGSVLKELKNNYEETATNRHALEYLRESLLFGVELPRIAMAVNKIAGKKINDDTSEELKTIYRDYYPEVDEAAFAALLKAYRDAVSPEMLPDIYELIDKKFKGNYSRYAQYLFTASVYSNKEKALAALSKRKFKFDKDPLEQFTSSVMKKSEELREEKYNKAVENIEKFDRLYVEGLKKWADERGSAMYPDANFTMRLTYGQILGYEPNDGSSYRFYTTTKGILEKEDSENPEFTVPIKLKYLINKNDYGSYTDQKSNKMHVNFLSNNDITGGNSGSPVFNGKGEVIGLAFDGNWEAMSGDIIFEQNMQRCINVDIRFVLFIMEKYGEATRLIEELTIN